MDRQSIIDEDSVFSAPVTQNPKLIILQTVKDKTSKQAQFKVRMMGYIMRDNSYNTQQPLNLSVISISWWILVPNRMRTKLTDL